MEEAKQYLEFIKEIRNDLEANIFQDVVTLGPMERLFLRKLLLNHNTIFLHILNIKNEFNPFIHAVIPFLINTIADDITQIIEVNRFVLVDTIQVIKFLGYSAVVSFYFKIEPEEIGVIKLTMESCFKLLEKQIKKPITKMILF